MCISSLKIKLLKLESSQDQDAIRGSSNCAVLTACSGPRETSEVSTTHCLHALGVRDPPSFYWS